MKIKKLYLKNFSRVKSALGVDEVTIDLTKSDNLFTFLQGNNGSGKSTLLNQLHPWRDSYDGNGSITYDEAIKEVTIDHENGEYFIKHVYAKVAKTFIYRNGELLNSNGNVREAETIINSELGYTPEFLELSRISSSMSSFLDKKSTERKKFITSLMPSIDYYIKSHDKIRSKILEENRSLRSLSAEISKLDSFNEEDLVLIEENIKRISEEITKKSNEIAVSNSNLEGLRTQAKDITYVSDTEISEYNDRIDSFSKSLSDFIELYGKKSTSLANEELSVHKEQLIKNNLNKEAAETKLKQTKEQIGVLTNSIREDEELLEKLTAVDVDKIQEEINKYENILKSIDVNEKFYKYLINKEIETKDLPGLDNFVQYMINSRVWLGKYYKELDSIGIINIQNKETEEKNKIIPVKTEIKNLETTINQDSLRYKDFMDSQKGNSKHCDNPNCPYEMEIKQYESLGEKIEKDTRKLRELERELEKIEDDISEISLIKAKAEEWIILKKRYSTSTFNIFNSIYNVIESDDLSADLREFSNTVNKAVENISLHITSTKGLEQANKSLEESKDKASLMDNINKRLENNKNILTKEKENVIVLEYDIEEAAKRRVDIENVINLYNDFIEAKEELRKVLEDKEAKIKEQTKWNEIHAKIKEIGEEITLLTTAKSTLEGELNTYSSRQKELQRLKINKEILDNNIKEVQETLETLKPINDVLDPRKGIPVVFQRVYLKQTAYLANKLLKVAYGDKFDISFELTENDFFIRVVDSEGNVRDDARTLSDGEKSVVGLSLSLALIEQTGNRDKILYLDEADGVLDSNNRRSFISILENQLVLLGIEQCFIISHNDSFKDTEADVILLRDDDNDPDHLEQKASFLENKNVIFDYKDLE